MSVAKRALQGLTWWRPELTYNGFTLFTPMAEEPANTWLIDMRGRFVHRWKLGGLVRNHAVLLPNGNLLYGMLDPESPIAYLTNVGGKLIEMDWDGNIVWNYKEPYHHSHDFTRLRSGNTMISKYVAVPKEIAAKVKGGTPGSEDNGTMWGDILQEITPDGRVVWEHVAHEHLDFEVDTIHPIAARYYWTCWNSIVELPDGNIMTCAPFLDNIYIIEKASGKIKWRWGRNILARPHNPTMLDNGNILVFDNGRYRIGSTRPWPLDYSRVVEVNPNTNEIEWEYMADNPHDFYSSFISGCQRLPNGNTLICEGERGRIFEITARGELVWEYVVPLYFHHHRPWFVGYVAYTNAIFRAHRYGPDYPGLQGKRFDPEKLEPWNRLYGPEAFGTWTRPSWKWVESAATESEEEPTRKEEPSTTEKPSVARPGERLRSRLKILGY